MTDDDYTHRARQYVAACGRRDLGRRARLVDELETTLDDSPLRRPGALGNAALWYARNGVAVFPCEPRGKRPIVERGLHAASTDPAKIVEWWRRTPAANIGAPTGHLFDVIDVDGPDGVGAVYCDGVTLPAELGHALTARRAGHHLFIAPTGRPNGANVYPHVDYRGLGGYVVMPPSIGANGRRYVWTTPLDLEAARKAAA